MSSLTFWSASALSSIAFCASYASLAYCNFISFSAFNLAISISFKASALPCALASRISYFSATFNSSFSSSVLKASSFCLLILSNSSCSFNCSSISFWSYFSLIFASDCSSCSVYKSLSSLRSFLYRS